MDVILLKDKKTVENIFDHEDFCELLREHLGDDAEQYFRRETDPEVILEGMNLTDNDILKNWCTGECDHVQGIQEHFEALLKECDSLAMEVYDRMMDEFLPGAKRSRKEQFALDKVIAIHNLVVKNT